MALPSLNDLLPDHLFYGSSACHRPPPPTTILKHVRPSETEPLYTSFQPQRPTTPFEPQSGMPYGQTYVVLPPFHLPPPTRTTFEDGERVIERSTSLSLPRNNIGIGFTNDRHSGPSRSSSTGSYQIRTFFLEPSPSNMVSENEKDDADSNSGKGKESGAVNERYKKHTCPDCGKRFNRPSSLRIHLNTHTGAKPYVCPFPGCSRTFNVSSNMRRHYRNHEHRAPPPLPPQLQDRHQDRVDEDKNNDDGIAYAHWPAPIQPTQTVASGVGEETFESGSSSTLPLVRSRAPHNPSGDNVSSDVRYVYPYPSATTDTAGLYSALDAVYYPPPSALVGSDPALYAVQPGPSYPSYPYAAHEHYRGSVYVPDEDNHPRGLELGLASDVSRFDLQRGGQPNVPPTPPYTNEAASSPPVSMQNLTPLRHRPSISGGGAAYVPQPPPQLSHSLVLAPSHMRQHGLEHGQVRRYEGSPLRGVVGDLPFNRPSHSGCEKDRSGWTRRSDYPYFDSRGAYERSSSMDRYEYAIRTGTRKDDPTIKDTDMDRNMHRDRDVMQQPSPDTPSLRVHALHGGHRRPASPGHSSSFVSETENKSHECGADESTKLSPIDAETRASTLQIQLQGSKSDSENGNEGAERSCRAGTELNRRSSLDIKAIMNPSDSSDEKARKVLPRISSTSPSSSPPPFPPHLDATETHPDDKAENIKVDAEVNSDSKSRSITSPRLVGTTPGAAPLPPYPLYNVKRRRLSPSPGPTPGEVDVATVAVENESTRQNSRGSGSGRRATKRRTRRRRG